MSTALHEGLQLRDYQRDALAAVAEAEARGVRAQMIVAATGLGKTVIFTALAQARGGRTLILAHRDELIQQAAAKVLEVWPGADVGVVKADRDEHHAQVVVASVQTLSRQTRLDRIMHPEQMLLDGDPEGFGLVVVDEAHHVAAESYQRILAGLRAGQVGGPCPCGDGTVTVGDGDEGGGCHLEACPDCDGTGTRVDGPLLVGVTATPQRGDGKGLDGTFQEVVYARDMLWGIRQGYLSDLTGKRVVVDMNLGELKIRRGDYDQGQAGALMEQAGAPDLIAAQWLEHARGRRTLVFTPTVAVAQQTADAFQRLGVRAGWVSGETPLDERRATLAAYSSGELEVLANCAVLTEGYDEPRTDCIVVARPTRSQALYVQMVGRGTRVHPDKSGCLVLDVVGASNDHSLVTIPSLFGLDVATRKRMEAEGIGAAQALADYMEREALAGRIRAEEADLWKMTRRDGLAWVSVHEAGAELKRFVLSLAKGKRLVLKGTGESWGAGLVDDDDTHVLIRDVSMTTAQAVAEDWVRVNGDEHISVLTDTKARWRKAKPSTAQLAAARKWHLAVDPKWTKGELSDALTAHIERRKAR